MYLKEIFQKSILKMSERNIQRHSILIENDIKYFFFVIVKVTFVSLEYQPAMHPGIAHVFQSAAMRFGHTMVTPGVMRRYWELMSFFFR